MKSFTPDEAAAALKALQDLSDWIDSGNAHRNAEARTWGRLAKASEESGEMIAAYIALTGQNPRKPMEGTVGDVVKEALDLAVTALGVVEHLTDNQGFSFALLFKHLAKLDERRKASNPVDPKREAAQKSFADMEKRLGL